MLEKFEKRMIKKNSSLFSDIDFDKKNGLIYHIKNEFRRLCISVICEKKMFELIHNFNNHAGFHRTYHRLTNIIFMSKLSRKTRQYVKHCSICELNQIKKHAFYEKLMSMTVFTISFRIIAMNFIVTLSKKYDSMLTIICKTSKKMTIIFEKII